MSAPRFRLGAVQISDSAFAELENAEQALAFLARHASGDWGELDADDRAVNDAALLSGDQVMSIYKLANGEHLYVITTPDRTTTTLIMWDEY